MKSEWFDKLQPVKILKKDSAVCIVTWLTSICCSYFDMLRNSTNEILTIFSLLIPISMGALIQYKLHKVEVYGDAIEYSSSIKKLQSLLWYQVNLLFLLFFINVLDIDKLKKFLLMLGITQHFLFQCFNKNTILYYIVFSQIIFIYKFFLDLLNLKEENLVKEIFSKLAEESNKKQLRQYFTYFCTKNNDKLTFALRMLAVYRNKDLFLISDDDRLSDITSDTTTLMNKALVNSRKKDVKLLTYADFIHYLEHLRDTCPLRTL